MAKMVLSKYILPNGNVFIWLGRGGIWGESKGIDNVLILAGGDILFLETSKCLSLSDPEIGNDIKNLSRGEFIKKYEMPVNGDLWKELKQGVVAGEYPPFRQKTKARIGNFQTMISAYITNILHLKDRNERMRQLKVIIQECRNHLLKTRAEIETSS